MLIYFLRGTLPWRKIRAPTHPPPDTPGKPEFFYSALTQTRLIDFPPYNPVSATWDLIRDAKLEAELTLADGLPPEFGVLYHYARNLSFDDLPDYEGLRQLFRGLAERMNIEYDYMFDWTVPPPASQATNDSTPDLLAGMGGGGSGSGSGGGRFCEACQMKKRHAHEAKAGAKKRR